MSRPPDIVALKEKYKSCIKTANMLGALEALDAVTEACKITNEDVPIFDIAHNCFLYLSPDLKYENLINQYHGRKISDATLFYLNEEIRRRTFLQSFAPARTLLTPHRKRQLIKTMNAEPRVFGFGLNFKKTLGLDAEDCAYVDIPTQVNIPPVYKMKMSSNHTIFWLHDGRFFGCGDWKNYMIAPQPPETIDNSEPHRCDFMVKPGERATGFKVLEFGTLFETNQRLYFVGNYDLSKEYLKTIHDAEFEKVQEYFPHNSNFWVCHSRPYTTIMRHKLDDGKNAVTIKILGLTHLIQIYPGYWTELNPSHVKQRPVCYLLDGQEVKNLRIENITNNTLWALHENALYHGTMMMMLKENNDGDEHNLDNYILFVELLEYRTPTPFVATGIAASGRDSVLMKCGDFPYIGFDHFEMLENRFRGEHVHKFMFETVEKYIENCYDQSQYTICQKEKSMELNIDYLAGEANQLLNSGLLDEELKIDFMGRTKKQYRYANFISFLCYAVTPRLPTRPPKCFDMDIDVLIETDNMEFLARHRFKQLIEEFERVNYPGTNIWIPLEFRKAHSDPEDDVLTEGQYRATALKWCLKDFIRQIIRWKSHSRFDSNERSNLIMIKYLINTIWYIHDQWFVINNPAVSIPKDDLFLSFLRESQYLIPDDELIYPSLNPGELLENRLREGYLLNPGELEEQLDIRMTFLLEHRDPTLKPTRLDIQTCRTILNAQYPALLHYINEHNVLDLNKVYPNDKRIHRLIAQTHFIGNGVTDLEGCEKYRLTVFEQLGMLLVHTQSYMRRGRTRYRGYVKPINLGALAHLAGHTPGSNYDIPVVTSDGSLIYCHRIIPALYSTLRPDEPLPNILSPILTVSALRGLYDRRCWDSIQMNFRVKIVDFYFEAKMNEAFIDLLKQCVIDATTKEAPQIRALLDDYPTQMQRIIAKHRPAILLWSRVPVPSPRIQHITIILEMWPKNEYERHTRLPRKKLVHKNGVVEDSVFHQISNKTWRTYYTNAEERQSPRFTKQYEKDFPLGYKYKPFIPSIVAPSPPTVSSAAPMAPDKRKGTTMAIAQPNPNPPKNTPLVQPEPQKPVLTPAQLKEERMKSLKQQLTRLSAGRGKTGRKGRKK